MSANHPGRLLCTASFAAACVFLSGCATTTQGDRSMLAVPTALSDAYTEINLRLKLATSIGMNEDCDRSGCMESVQFDERVARVGERLARTAYLKFPGLVERIPSFEFSVIDKSEPGTASTSNGIVVVLRPVSALARTDEALSFVLAREIGHVVAQHHEENTGTSLLVSLVATVMAPVSSVLKLISTVYSSASTIVASVSVTAASYASSRLLIASYRPRQLDEADRIALEILSSAGLASDDVVAGFPDRVLLAIDGPWVRDLRRSVDGLAQRTAMLEAARVAALAGGNAAAGGLVLRPEPSIQ